MSNCVAWYGGNAGNKRYCDTTTNTCLQCTALTVDSDCGGQNGCIPCNSGVCGTAASMHGKLCPGDPSSQCRNDGACVVSRPPWVPVLRQLVDTAGPPCPLHLASWDQLRMALRH